MPPTPRTLRALRPPFSGPGRSDALATDLNGTCLHASFDIMTLVEDLEVRSALAPILRPSGYSLCKQTNESRREAAPHSPHLLLRCASTKRTRAGAQVRYSVSPAAWEMLAWLELALVLGQGELVPDPNAAAAGGAAGGGAAGGAGGAAAEVAPPGLCVEGRVKVEHNGQLCTLTLRCALERFA